MGELDIWEAPSIGVFLCRCEGCVSGTIDLDYVKDQVEDLSDVKHASSTIDSARRRACDK